MTIDRVMERLVEVKIQAMLPKQKSKKTEKRVQEIENRHKRAGEETRTSEDFGVGH